MTAPRSPAIGEGSSTTFVTGSLSCSAYHLTGSWERGVSHKGASPGQPAERMPTSALTDALGHRRPRPERPSLTRYENVLPTGLREPTKAHISPFVLRIGPIGRWPPQLRRSCEAAMGEWAGTGALVTGASRTAQYSVRSGARRNRSVMWTRTVSIPASQPDMPPVPDAEET